MEPFWINGKLVYIQRFEDLREYVSTEIFAAIEHLESSWAVDDLREDVEDLEKECAELEARIKDIRELTCKKIGEIEKLERIRKDGVLSRLEEIEMATYE